MTREIKGCVIDGISPRGKFKLNVSYLSQIATCVKLKFYCVGDFNINSFVCFLRVAFDTLKELLIALVISLASAHLVLCSNFSLKFHPIVHVI